MSIATYYIILIILGLLPSAIWLAYYLRKDCHPEPKYLIAKTFLMGIIVSPLVIAAGFLIISAASKICDCQISIQDYRFLLWAAFLEEFIKFYAVKLLVLNSSEFDEPVDAMVYMITAGLGFAAMENILYLSRTIQEGITIHATLGMHAQATLSVWLLRFTGATLLHTLSSALLGYFLALSWFFQHHRRKLFYIGLVLATIFHFTFNILVSTPLTPESWNPLNRLLVNQAYSTFLLITMAFLISILFDKIRERSTTNPTLA
ncbi:MAG: PrsW family intramembrane metalloprotease [Patescibacteria group bacterium]